MLTTIIIIGILAAIATLSVTKFRSRSVIQACATDVRTTQVALDSYKAKYSGYPPQTTDLTSPTAGGVLPQRGSGQLDDSSDYDITYALGSAATPTDATTYRVTVTKTASNTATILTPLSTKDEIETACKK